MLIPLGQTRIARGTRFPGKHTSGLLGLTLTLLAVSTLSGLPTLAQNPSGPVAASPTKVAEKTTTQADGKPLDVSAAKSPQTPEQRQLAEDSAKLLVLANELKVELDKSSKDTLSLTVVKKAEEVEKLAHKVKEEMKKTLVNQ